MPYAPDVRFIELFIDGSYEGVYLMMETVSKGEGALISQHLNQIVR